MPLPKVKSKFIQEVVDHNGPAHPDVIKETKNAPQFIQEVNEQSYTHKPKEKCEDDEEVESSLLDKLKKAFSQ